MKITIHLDGTVTDWTGTLYTDLDYFIEINGGLHPDIEIEEEVYE